MARDESKPRAFGVSAKGFREVLDALKALPAEINDALRDASGEIAGFMAADIRAAGFRRKGQAALVASTVGVKRDRLPMVVVGGTAGVGRHHTPAWRLLMGSEFGVNQPGSRDPKSKASTNKYRPWGLPRRNVPHGYWLFSTLERDIPAAEDLWLGAVDDVIARFDG